MGQVLSVPSCGPRWAALRQEEAQDSSRAVMVGSPHSLLTLYTAQGHSTLAHDLFFAQAADVAITNARTVSSSHMCPPA
jgi:hypothetical protein